MQNVEFVVKVPAVLSALSGFVTKNFNGENPQKNKRKAMKYLSEVIIGCVEKKQIIISDFNRNGSSLYPIKTLREDKYLNKDGILNFPKLFQCKIDYHFSDEIMRETLGCRHDADRKAQIMDFLGTICLEIKSESNKRVATLLSIDNNYEPYKINNRAKQFGAEDIISSTDFMQLPIFKNILEHRELRDELHRDFHYEKTIVRDGAFIDFEKNFLSLMNIALTEFRIFVEIKHMSEIGQIIGRLKKTYRLKFNIKTNILRLENENLYVLSINKPQDSGFVYSKKGELFYRNGKGAVVADQHTTQSDITNVPVPPPMKRILSIL